LTGAFDPRSLASSGGRLAIFIRSLILAAAPILVAGAAFAKPPAPGTSVASSTFTTANGQSLTIGDLRGQVVVLTYWTSDCGACDVQVAMLDYYYRQRRNLGLQVLVIPAEELTDGQLREAFKGKGVRPLSRIRGPFEPLDRLPTTYVVDRYGKLRFAQSGLLGVERLNQMLVPLLRQPQP
jgi:cytochrome c biogenesis protein CcmG/thiol:disulfide interchange protein DsbE